MRKNLFGVNSVCDEIVSAHVREAIKSFLRLLSQSMLYFQNVPKKANAIFDYK
jgi:hypothetical protein